jgi:hypothetical protein
MRSVKGRATRTVVRSNTSSLIDNDIFASIKHFPAAHVMRREFMRGTRVPETHLHVFQTDFDVSQARVPE